MSIVNTNTKLERLGNALVKWGVVLKLTWDGTLKDPWVLIIVMVALGVDSLSGMLKSFKEKKLNGNNKLQ